MAKKHSKSGRRRDPYLTASGVFITLKGVVLAAVTLGVARLMHKDVRDEVEHWLNIVRVDPDNRLVGGMLRKLNVVHTKEVKELTAVGAFYAALFLTEGAGLLYSQRWAEWLTVVATGVLLPIEIYGMLHEFSFVKVGLFIVNAAVVTFLVWRIRSDRS